MCKVYNTIGCLTTIRERLTQNNIHDFNSINELLSFQDSYSAARQEIISKHKALVSESRDSLSAEVLALENQVLNDTLEIQKKLKSEISTLRQKHDDVLAQEKNLLQEIIFSFVVVFLLLKIKYKEYHFDSVVSESIQAKADMLAEKRNRLQYMVANFDQAVKKSSGPALHNLDRKKRVIGEINSFIYGAMGEQKVVKELEKLSDEYTLINDFSISFDKALYYRQERQYIKSIQIDHLLISPAGIFLIETKNWSNESLKNLNLFSPVQQIKRTNFALFKILSESSLPTFSKHHWGERKIPIRNLIVLINQKPVEEFQHVKVLTLPELLRYVEYFKPTLSSHETQSLADYLLKL